VKIVLQILDALERAHALEIVHRDLKPHNVMVSASGDVKILDFGIAKMKDSGEPVGLTRTGTVMGTLAYMSPEQAGGEAVDGRSDLYSVGVILYELLTGEAPFKGKTAGELMKQQLFTAPPRPRDKRPEIPLSLEAVVLRALEKEPDKRFKDAHAFGDALRATVEASAATVIEAPRDARTTADAGLDGWHPTCPHCKAALPDDARFCHACGKSTTIVCPACRRDTAAGSRHCTRCGVELAKATQPKPAVAPPPGSSPVAIALIVGGVLFGLCLFGALLLVLFSG
jgi:hypothetical protein